MYEIYSVLKVFFFLLELFSFQKPDMETKMETQNIVASWRPSAFWIIILTNEIKSIVKNKFMYINTYYFSFILDRVFIHEREEMSI